MTTPARPSRRAQQRGTAAVEFALVAALFFTVLFGVIEMGRLLWTWNAAAEATRLGARLAAVCSMNDPGIRKQMRARLGTIQDANIVIDYLSPTSPANSCTPATCTSVRVSLQGVTFNAAIPFVPVAVPMPAFTTSLRREAMDSTGNAVCQ